MAAMTARNLLIAGIVLLGIACAGLGYEWRTTWITLKATETKLASTTEAAARAAANAEADNQQLSEALAGEKERNDSFQERIDDLSGTVGKLDKLSRIDPELLQKYSKVFFLSDTYVPQSLAEIDENYRTMSDKKLQFLDEAYPFLKDLLNDAEDDGVNLTVLSAYRSFGTQAALKSGYTIRYGSGANAFSADQGYSEHQLGTTLDFATTETGNALTVSFETTKAFAWLQDNAYRYGFVLSYPKGNTYYQYEPWHWRFVGRELARDLHRDDKNFYELDQRELDSYLISIFD